MRKFYTLTILLVFHTCNIQAQNLIAVQNGGNPTFYEKLEDAISNAVAKDTIFIPGGVFQNIPGNTLTINKELHLIGAGYHPDSTSVTNPTCINATIVVVSGANKSTFEGFLLNGGLFAGSSTTNDDVDDITISRCNIAGMLMLSGLSSSWSIHENIISGGSQGNHQSVSSPYAQNNLFSNNIIQWIDAFGSGNQFRNNIIYSHGWTFVSCDFENNLFFSWFSNNITLCTLNNNLTDRVSTTIPDGNFGSNNIIDYTSFLSTQLGNSFRYTFDYHLKPDCPGKNAGKDGTDIGIYGGLYPWKAGSVPTNPHIQFNQVSGTTNNSGNLNVKIKVAAQDH